MIIVDNEEILKTKCVNKNIVDSIRHKKCVDMLFGKVLVKHYMQRIQSKMHKSETYVCKISLSCFDDKGYIFDNGISSLGLFSGFIFMGIY